MSDPATGRTGLPASLQGLAALADQAGRAARARPVERWNPPYCGEIDMRVRADGTWLHAGTPIGREALVRLFASVLRREPDGSYVLVTPVEKLGLVVEDAPFLAVEMNAEGRGPDAVLTFRTNVGDLVAADDAHPFRFALETSSGGLKPYVLVRGGLEALLTRAVTYELADRAEMHAGRTGIWSGGRFFPWPDGFDG